MKKIGVLLVGFLLVMSVGIAGAAVINFDDLEVPTSISFMASYSSNGFTFSTSQAIPARIPYGFASWDQSHPYYNTSAALFNNWVGEWTTLSADSGSTFTLNSIDLDWLYLTGPVNVHFYAYDSTDILLSELSYDLTNDGWATVNFGSGFENISYLKFQQTLEMHQFDNVVLNEGAPVPEPATMLLFGIGLLGLAGVSRRK